MGVSDFARIYVHASYASPFKSGWGAVIQHNSRLVEINEAGEGDDISTLHIVAATEALRALPADVPVKIISSLAYLTDYAIPEMPQLRMRGYQSKNGKIDHSDLLKALDTLITSRPAVAAKLVKKVDWDERHKRAALLAGLHGQDAATYDLQAKAKARARQIKPGEPTEDYW